MDRARPTGAAGVGPEVAPGVRRQAIWYNGTT